MAVNNHLKDAILEEAMNYRANSKLYSDQKRTPACLATLEPEKLEPLLDTVQKTLDAVAASGGKRIEPTDRKKIQDDFELSDLQMASAVSWTPREFLRRRTSAEVVESKEAGALETTPGGKKEIKA
mmetsp:Transcript_63218/g.108572  ORF Transcript_63218/g.108572 Transcript_63218/m.108572 type:complete len:126 (-) Transcript_63218:189-566(-)